MSAQATKTIQFNLTGPGLRVSYRAAGPELELDGDLAGLSSDQRTFEADQLDVEETEIGTWISAHLLTSRGGQEITFRVLVPAVVLGEDEDETDVTAVALTTTDMSHAVGSTAAARCEYDVRQLTGSAARASD